VTTLSNVLHPSKSSLVQEVTVTWKDPVRNKKDPGKRRKGQELQNVFFSYSKLAQPSVARLLTPVFFLRRYSRAYELVHEEKSQGKKRREEKIRQRDGPT
jgi:hypothetical protein